MVKIYCNDKLKNVLKINGVENYLPAYSGESAGLDLYNTGNDIIIPYIGKKIKTPKTLIPTGLHISVPKGYVALIQERGSVVKTNLKVRAGVIDCGYTGEVFVNLINLSEFREFACINKGSKLPVQLVVVKCDNDFQIVSENEYLNLSDTSNRKDGQIGSSD